MTCKNCQDRKLVNIACPYCGNNSNRQLWEECMKKLIEYQEGLKDESGDIRKS